MSIFSNLCTDIVDFGESKCNPRLNPVSKITVHHMASVQSGSDCAHSHRDDPSREASANYYIGNAGDICGGVSEDRRAWTTGTGNKKDTNDHMAITIEVSNSDAKEPWPVSDAAYKATIKLCADICRRYNITPKYDGTRNATLTLHYMFQATACPGTTWKQLFSIGQVERDILKELGTTSNNKPVNGGSTEMTSEQKIWNFLLSKLNNEYGVAGMMGNLFAESGLRPNNLQNTFEISLGMTDAQYTAAIDNGSYSRDKFVHDSAGYGLAQWTFWSRKQNMYDYIKGKGKSIADLDEQLNYLWQELSNNYKGMLPSLCNATNVYDASTVVLTQFERPSDQSQAMKNTRANYSQGYYNKYAKGGTAPQPTPSSSPSGTPYAVRIIVDELNIRSGPGTTYEIVGQVHRGSAFTIVQEQNGWGKLKSGAGWIALNYTQRV